MRQRTPSKAAHRRERESREHALHERITMITIAVLAIVAVLIAAGVVLTVVLPPRARVLTVGEQQYTAAQVAQRAELAVRGGDQATAGDPVRVTLDNLTSEEVLLQAGGKLVGEPTEDDVKQTIRTRLGLADDASDEDYARAYQAFLRETPLSQEMYERSASAEVVRQRLVERFKGEVPARGTQLRLQGAAGADRMKLQQLRDAVAGSGDFGAEAVKLGLVQNAAAVDIGWLLPETLGALRENIVPLAVGQTTEPLFTGGASTVVYRLAERAEDREYDDAQKGRLAGVKVNDFVTEQRETLQIEEQVGDRERSWITGRVQDVAAEVAREQRAGQGAAPQGAGRQANPAPAGN